MSRLRIYGVAQSRTFRTLWTANELGLDYEHVPVRLDNGETRGDDFRAINPAGQIPAIVDGDLHLAESLAINLYLAETYGGGLWYGTAAERAKTLQWSFFAAAQVEEPLIIVLFQQVRLPEAERDPKVLAAAVERLKRSLGVLDAALGRREWLVGDHFGVADLNVAGILFLSGPAQFDLGSWPAVSAWLERCIARPAAQAALALRKG